MGSIYIVHSLYTVVSNHKRGLYSTVYIELYPTTRWDLYRVHSLYTAVPNPKMGSVQNVVYIHLYPYTVHSLCTAVPNHEMGSIST